jgi:hypothetical protein
MKKLLLSVIVLAPALLFAQSAFDGTWHFSTDSAEFAGKPTVLLLNNGIYKCETCVPKIDTKADGEDHPISGSPYYDTMNVREVNDHTAASTTKKNGKVVGTNKDTVSDDGKTLVSEWTFVAENGTEGHGKSVSTRTADGPAGANKVSGSWKTTKVDNASDSVLTVTYKVNGDEVSMSDPLGDSYTAKLDGKDYPYKGDPGTTSVSLKKIDANTIEETDKRDGKVISVTKMSVSADGKSMRADSMDKLHGTSSTFKGTKQ